MHDLQVFLVSRDFYRTFVAGHFKLAHPLTVLLAGAPEESAAVRLDATGVAAFCRLKASLLAALILHTFVADRTAVLETDLSG